MTRPATGDPQPLDEAFYARPADVVAPDLLGKVVLVKDPATGAFRGGRIVEVEAYVGAEDLACHASKGLTRRTSTLFGPPGHAYVYLIYGMYRLFNVVCQPVGVAHAVLVRGVEPLGPEASERVGAPLLEPPSGARGDGPGRLTRALGIDLTHDKDPLYGPRLYLVDGPPPGEVAVTPRVGVAYAGSWADAPLRYLDAASPHVSRPPPSQVGSGRPRG